jgi:hypothetical protein
MVFAPKKNQQRKRSDKVLGNSVDTGQFKVQSDIS